jgi:SAM-dependent methyltransferase
VTTAEDRARAVSFGTDAERYDRARPSYPAALIDDLCAGSTPSVLDVGCGTGIASRLFAARGCTILGVEPDARMAAVAESRGTPVEVGAFEAWDPRGRHFDVVISAQAWHWVEPFAGARHAASVLVPGGRIGLFWNTIHHDPTLAAAMEGVYASLGHDPLGHAVVLGAMDPRRFVVAAEGIAQSGEFGPAEQREYAWTLRYTGEEWIENLRTHSDHLALDPEVAERLYAALGDVIDAHGGVVPISVSTVLVTASLR